MPYTFELAFTGLCVFTLGGDDPWHPEEVNALLVDTAHDDMDDEHAHVEHDPHVPLLTCWPQDLAHRVPRDFRLAPTPDGRLIALRSLRGEALTIHLPEHARRRLVLNWSHYEAYPIPEGQAQEDWMNWSTPISKVYPCMAPPTPCMPYAGLNELAVASRVKLEHGELIATDFPRIRDDDSYVRWEFKESEDHGEAKERARTHHVQALAGVVYLRVPGLDSDEDTVRIASDTWELVFAPASSSRTLIRASITNLLNREPQEENLTSLKHYLHLKKLVRWRPEHGKPKLPTREGGHVTSGNSFCPPLSFVRPQEE